MYASDKMFRLVTLALMIVTFGTFLMLGMSLYITLFASLEQQGSAQCTELVAALMKAWQAGFTALVAFLGVLGVREIKGIFGSNASQGIEHPGEHNAGAKIPVRQEKYLKG